MTNPTYTFPEMTAHILNGDADTLPIIHELLCEEKKCYPLVEVQAMFQLLKFQYDLVSGALMKGLLNSILK